ncbi:MAG: Transcription initiation factor IIA small chain (TFIIA 13.5 kDa subunit) [Chaenotheca gracillima]|nr:MAG: Transcription initiation factor IIA small chain (TFIIA 13.5 kDa subunit) [Chaenotheca gracillima]
MVRIKHRYLLVHILYPSGRSSSHTAAHAEKDAEDDLPWPVQFHRPTPAAINTQLLLRAIRNQIQFLYGDWGAGVTSASLAVKYFSNSTSTFILRVARAHYRLVAAALAWMNELPSDKGSSSSGRGAESGANERTDCIFRVVRVSGTIRKSEEEALRRAKEVVWRLKDTGMDEEAGVETHAIGKKLVGEATVTRRDSEERTWESDEYDDEDEEDEDEAG